jgi:hypothetical protein
MIGGVQKKMLLTINNSKFELDELFKELVGPSETTKWKLVRERDNLTKYSEDIVWMEWNEDRTFKAKHEHIGIGYSLLMSPFTAEFTWQTTEIVDFHVRGDGGWYFKTKNSNYILYKHEQI